MHFQIDHDPISGGHLIVARGELDIGATPRLSTVLAMAGASHGGRLVLDLAGVDFIDSTALGVLVQAERRVRERGGRIALVTTDPNIVRVLQITALDRLFPVYATRAAASTALAGRSRA